MRILFLLSGTIWVHTLPEGFRDAGHEVMISGTISEYNIPKLISEFKPHLLVSMGWGTDQTKERQLIARKYSKASKIPHIYWSLEDPAYTWEFSIPLLQRMQPDFVFTICPQTVEYFKKLGFNAAHMDFGFAPKIHRPVDMLKEYNRSIAVVANAYPDKLESYPNHYRHKSLKTLITPLLQENIPIDFWGRHWKDIKKYIGYDVPDEWNHGYLPYVDAHKVYSSAQIIIGLQNYTTQVTQRTYEILACGGFLLTSDTPGVRNIFSPNEHLVVSSSPEDTLRLIKYYLNNPDECRKIGEQGKDAVAGNNYKERAKYMIDVLRRENIIKV